jgi:hypothetical protein
MKLTACISGLLLATALHAAIQVDTLLHWQNLPRGVANVATVRNGMAGTLHSVTAAGWSNDFSRFYLVAAPATNTLSFTCNGTNYTTFTNWIKSVTQTNIADDVMEVKMFAGDVPADSIATNVHFFGLCLIAITNQSGSLVNIDPILLYGAGGGWAVLPQFQLAANGGDALAVPHAAGFGTLGETCSGIQGKVVLWEAIKENRFAANGVGRFRYRDPNNGMALIGEGSINVAGGAGIGQFFNMIFLAGYIGDPDGAMYWSGIGLRYNTTNFLTDSELGVGNLIEPTNRWDFAPGWNLGVRGGIPARTGTVRNVTSAPYSADNTGATDAGAAINSAITASSSNDIVYLPAGTYNCKTNAVTLNKSGVTLRGDGASSVIFGTVNVGHSSSGGYAFYVTNGATKGSTNLVLTSVQDQFSSTIAAGDLFKISSLENDTNGGFPVIATTTGGKWLTSQMVQCFSINGNTVTISSPLIWDFTNQTRLTSRTLTGGGGGTRPAIKMGVESLRVTGTNHGVGTTTSQGYNIFVNSTADCWLSNVVSEYALNYGIGVENTLRTEIMYCTARYALNPVGTSRSGAIFTDSSEYLMRDCIFHDWGLAWQHFGGVSGNAAVGIFATNLTGKGAFLNHSTHNIFNIVEASILSGAVSYDGFFGSSSHAILYRNRITSTTSFKRFSSHMQVIGNVLGSTNYPYQYIAAETNDFLAATGFYGIFELGFPNIGNTSFTGTTPPTSWNWPGTNYTADNNTIETNYPNPIATFLSTVGPTNRLYGNFTNRVAPYEIWTTSTPAVIFQGGTDTNQYYTGTNPPVQVLTNYGDSIVLNQFVTVSNGWSMYGITAPSSYQQLQASNKHTHRLHGNLVYTNAAGTLVWDANVANQTMPASLVYANGAPDWWGTNRWPAIDPERAAPVAMIPAQARYLGIGQTSPRRLRIKLRQQ